jgi:hypothetical protein
LRPETISWLPATGVVRPFRIEQGRNLSSAQTLARECEGGKRVASWGPYEITPGLYRRAMSRIKLLNSRKIAFSELGLEPATMNCIKATGDITETPFRPGITWGFAASQAVVRHLRPFIRSGQINKSTGNRLATYECRRPK